MTIKKLPANDDRLWSLAQVKDFVKQAKQRVGGEMGWEYISRQMREAAIAQQALYIVTGIERGEVPCAAIGCLHRDMREIAGLNEE
jgi:hypothetical protein